ncbi:MAG TPA: hypothetical protein VIF35_12205, partial [Streptosporangiaceae bacterium]
RFRAEMIRWIPGYRREGDPPLDAGESLSAGNGSSPGDSLSPGNGSSPGNGHGPGNGLDTGPGGPEAGSAEGSEEALSPPRA